jgi:hypothetical protein
MLKAGALALVVAGLLGCTSIERANSDVVTITYYGTDLEEVTGHAQRWCERFNRRAQVTSIERLDGAGFWFRTYYRCVEA